MAASVAFSINVIDPTPAFAQELQLSTTDNLAAAELKYEKVEKAKPVAKAPTTRVDKCTSVKGSDVIQVKSGMKITEMCL